MATSLMGSANPEWVRLEVAPATGSTTVMPPNYNQVLYTNPGTIAAQTLDLPASPFDGQLVNISNFAAITALTLSPAVTGAPSGLTAGQGLMIMYSVPQAVWFVFS